MALVLKDRVKETTTTTGTGTVTLAGAAAGFQSFAAVGDGNQTFYAIADATSGDWEVGVGTYTASGTTLSRTTVVSSSNAGSLVNFSAGTKDVFVTYPSSRAVYLDAAGSAVTTLDIGTLGTSTANITTANITAGTVSTTPTSANDLVNKTYVDTLAASGIHFHQPVRVESPINLNATYNNGTAGVGATLTNAGTQAALVIDGITMVVADRVLIYEQTTQTQNGVYVVTDIGSGSTNWILTRSSDADTYVINSADGLSEGSTVFVQQGATGAGETYTCNTSGVITFGTTNITFAQISSAQIYSAGTGLTLSGTQFSITNTGTAGTYGSASSVPVITTNAQGQVTGVTPTAIAISGAAVSGNISGQAGSVANALTAGTYLTSGGTYNGSAARTFAVDATDANTASKVVARDASGNFSAGTITATLSGAATSATTATNLAGGAANRIAYQTGAGVTNFAVAPTASNQVLNWNGSAFTWSAGTISGVALGSNLNTLTFGTYLTGTSYNGSGAVTLATNATNTNTANAIVARDGSGNFSANVITAALSGNATTATTAANVNNGTLTMNVSGTGLSGSQTFTANQSAAATFTVTSNATNANTASTIVARDSNGDFQAGSINTTRALTDVSGGNASLRVVSPGGAAFYTSGGNGAIQIQLPAAATGSMFRMTITVWTFDGQSFDIRCGAYIYSGGIANQFAYMMTGSRAALNTRWGWDGSRHSFFIGNIGEFWSYPVVSVTDVQAGYSNYAASNWQAGWVAQLNNSSYGTVLSGPNLTTLLATTATTATNLAGGVAGNLHYQTGAGTSAFVANGTSGQFLRSNGTAAPSWVAAPTTTPAGSSQQIQFNNGGTFGASSNLLWDGTKIIVGSTWLWQPVNFTNVAVGNATLNSFSLSGSNNTAVGASALSAVTSGAGNTAVGRSAGQLISTGGFNTAVGSDSLIACTTGSRNIAMGNNTLRTCVGSGSNVAIGHDALYNLAPFGTPSNGENVAVGFQAGYSGTSAAGGVLLGMYAGYSITTGNRNICLGQYAGFSMSTGSGNVAIGGLNAGGGLNPVFNITTQSNHISMGTGTITNAYVQVAWTVVSDARDKTDFAPVPHGLDFVTKLKPTAYRFKESRDATEGHGPLRYGFKAQDILELEGDNPVVIDAGTPEKLYFNDQNLLAILVKAVQEQQVIIDQLKADVAALKGN